MYCSWCAEGIWSKSSTQSALCQKNAVMVQNTKNSLFIQNEAGEGIFFRRVSRVLPVHLVEVESAVTR